MKDEIKERLESLGEPVYYGGGVFRGRDSWDCLVFGKRRLKNTGKDFVQIWFVAIVKEEEIPDGMEQNVINALREIGLKRTDSQAEYAYQDKSGECMAEICVMEFYKTMKGCGK